MNPFQMTDNATNRMFLFQWLKRLGKIEDNDTSFNSDLNDLINMNFQLDKKDRNFNNLRDMLGREGSDFYNRFEQWLPNKSRGGFFNGVKDSFNFEKNIVTFDATYILDQPEVLPNITDYIFHQIMAQVSAEVLPHICFFDEAPRYFQEPIFAAKMLESLAEIRKKAGVCILAAQNTTQLTKLPKGVGSEVINALAHIICYPNPNATKEHYCEFLGFNETEYEWIKTTAQDAYKVIVKNRSTDSSVILDVNLTNLKTNTYNLLDCFNSSSGAVAKVKSLKGPAYDNNKNWRLKYLRR